MASGFFRCKKCTDQMLRSTIIQAAHCGCVSMGRQTLGRKLATVDMYVL